MRVAQVVPDLATFAVDDGFAYRIPDGLDVAVGSLVRIPLGNRRIRGYVVGLREAEPAGLKEINAVSGDIPVFDGKLLETLRWAALHYVAPLSVMLAKAAPPNLPRRGGAQGPWEPVAATEAGSLAAAIRGRTRSRPAFVMREPSLRGLSPLVTAAIGAGTTALVVVPTVAEGETALRALQGSLGDRVMAAWSALPAAEATRTWVTMAMTPGTVVVGTREVAWWPGSGLGVAIIAGEGRRGMKEPQTPTTHVREILRRRGAVERFPVISFGSVPTTETVAAGVELIETPGRAWPLTEIVDRSADPPGSGVLTERARSAIRSLAKRSGTGFILCRQRGDVVRCAGCRALRLCVVCGTSLGRNEACARCGAGAGACAECGGARFSPAAASVPRVLDEIRGIVGRYAGAAADGAPIVVGTERDMPRPGSVDIAVVVDGDGSVFAANYRAAEDALRLFARLAQTVRRGRGNRAIVQTSRPDHAVYETLRAGHPLPFLRDELKMRSRDRFPPIGELIAVEMQNPPSTAHSDLEAIVDSGTVLFGPAEVRDRQRWLIQGTDLHRVRIALRGKVQSWREQRARVRLDVDPIDL